MGTYATGRTLSYNELEFLREQAVELEKTGLPRPGCISDRDQQSGVSREVIPGPVVDEYDRKGDNDSLLLELGLKARVQTAFDGAAESRLGNNRKKMESSMTTPVKLDRRAVLKGIAGASLALPVLEAMGEEVSTRSPRRLCAIYTANGMSLPKPEHGIDDWSWFPRAKKDGQFVFGKSTEPLAAYRDQLSFLGGMFHENGVKADPHICSDMWLTGAPLHNPRPEIQLGWSRPDRRTPHQAVLSPALAGSLD
ncbi:MAG: hypothetical protein Ct9H300mP1_16460 [Planctomycetaceae bacterium]|nr:MAG: hypothetical protein Ct9H300mP1_16460 [Planctomycetaceae bacterium]